jgi:hypothetical protein
MNIMLDLETLGTRPTAPIIAIGACIFSTEGGIEHEFYQVIDLQSAVDSGAIIEAGSVQWWLAQGDEARAGILGAGVPLAQALQEFSQWLRDSELYQNVKGDTSPLTIWGNGAAFDNVILSEAYRRLKVKLPWSYSRDRCYRTVAAAHPQIKMERIGTHHHALQDAVSQALHLIQIQTQIAKAAQ